MVAYSVSKASGILKAKRSDRFAACVTNIIAVSAMPSMLVLRISRPIDFLATAGFVAVLTPVQQKLLQVENGAPDRVQQVPGSGIGTVIRRFGGSRGIV